jgi:ABC-type glycerol-3-phosphate transport system permease component
VSQAKTKRLVTFILLIASVLMAVIAIFPIYWMFITSLQHEAEMFTTKLRLLPGKITLENYVYAFRALPLLRIIMNTTFISVTRTILSLFLCSLAGFAFAKLRFRGRDGLFLLLIWTMTIPFEAVVIPTFLMMVKLKWVNTYYPLIVPMAADAFGIFLMRQYISSVPDELVDAARIDGCSYFRTYSSVILPVVKPALVTLAIFVFKTAWNDFLWPLVVIRKIDMQVLMVAIQIIPPIDPGVRSIPWGATMAVATISVLPLLILFLFLQREFISGATQGSIK